eukprot:CAMPEP_0185030104 /NCGR_PEP_ID=MMETSP1103-20130426/16863_1 /TAXON_ID=36769 /ORGANISM="Paraphysomonas bandaiensis, Strain Caron Lab Isolate" /LENGTH=414 /DNA_ID=CAMNT_0027565089 /DNA_START=680 /DNA_END=1920 /DNA_ORIENTATION=-
MLNDIIPCPQCGVQLVKGDGCNAITCVCGCSFHWNKEKKEMTWASEFVTLYSHNTASVCVDVLTTAESTDVNVTRAAHSWKRQNTLQYDIASILWWQRQFPLCPTQCCLSVPLQESCDARGISFLSLNTEEGAHVCQMWRNANSNKALLLEQQRDISVASLFDTFFPTVFDKVVLAQEAIRLSSSSIIRLEKMWPGMNSLEKRWICDRGAKWAKLASDKDDIRRQVSIMSSSKAIQFLCLFGHRIVSLQPSPIEGSTLLGRIIQQPAPGKKFVKGDRVALNKHAAIWSTVERQCMDGTCFLRHDNGDSGIYKSSRIARILTYVELAPCQDISQQQLDSFLELIIRLKSVCKSTSVSLPLNKLNHNDSLNQQVNASMLLNMIHVGNWDALWKCKGNCCVTWKQLYDTAMALPLDG